MNQTPYGEQGWQYQAPAYPGPGVGGGRAPAPRKDGTMRPGCVTVGLVLTHIGAAGTFVFALVMVTGLLGAAFLKNIEKGDFGELSINEARILYGCLGAGSLVLGVALIALAVHTARGRGGARVALTVIGAVFAALFGVSVVGDPWVIPFCLYIVLAVLLLWVGGANRWFRVQKAARNAAVQAPPAPPAPPAR